jgi:hypothetical protein
MGKCILNKSKNPKKRSIFKNPKNRQFHQKWEKSWFFMFLTFLTFFTFFHFLAKSWKLSFQALFDEKWGPYSIYEGALDSSIETSDLCLNVNALAQSNLDLKVVVNLLLEGKTVTILEGNLVLNHSVDSNLDAISSSKVRMVKSS